MHYIYIPRKHSSTSRIDEILEQRLRHFMLSRRRFYWLGLEGDYESDDTGR